MDRQVDPRSLIEPVSDSATHFDLYRDPLLKWERWFLAGLVPLLALFLLPMIGRVPRAYVDDSWSTSAGYTLAFEGKPRNPGQMGRGGTDTCLIQPRLFPNVICAVFYRLAGFGLTQGRLVAAVFCGIFVFATYRFIRLLFGPGCATATALMTVVDPWVFICGRTCREEIFLAALLWLSWWLLVDAMDRSSGKRAFLGGFLTGLACWTHPNALVFTLAIFIALTIMAGWKRTLGWWLIPVALGLFTGLLPYLAFVAYIQNTTEIRLAEQVAERSDILTRTIGSILTNEVKRWTNFIRLPERTPLLALYAWAAIWTAWRGTRKDRFLLILVLAMAIILPILVRVSHGRYLVVLVPALSAMIWRSLLKTWGPHTASSTSPASSKSFLSRLARRKGATIILVIYTLMSLAPTSAILWAYRNADYDRWVARVATTIPPDARVMGDTMFWIGLRNHPFISSIPPYYSDWRSVDDAVAHICKYRPDYLIQASSLYPGLDGLAPRSKNLRATRFGQACETMATRVPCQILTEFYDRDFGAVRVWKVNWPFPSTTSTNSGG